jgi:cell division protein FtsW
MIRRNTPALILGLALALIGIGLIMVYSASASKASSEKRVALKRENPEAYAEFNKYHGTKYLARQAMHAGAGIAIMLFLSAFGYHKLGAVAPLLLFAVFVGLCLVFVPHLGYTANGASRWVHVFGFKFQPSEPAKLVMIIYMAKMLVDRQREVRSFRKCVLPAAGVTGLFCGMILIEPDFGSAALMGGAVFLLWFISGVRIFHLAFLCCMMIPAAALGILTSPYRIARIRDWLLYIIDAPGGADYQVSQSVIAIGSGGLWGLGLGNSQQKLAFLNEAHTDFIFAVMAEELGFIRVAFVVLVFLFLLILGWRVALGSVDSLGGYLASGIVVLLSMSISLNILIALGVLPPKGLALPFISYGGSSMLVNCAAVGILINIAKQNTLAEQPIRRRRA